MNSKNTILTINKVMCKTKLNFYNKNIVAGFPGVGKSTAAKNHPEFFVDMESSEYHWIYTDGEKRLNPLWPYNYIKAIKEECSKTYQEPYPLFVLISTHKEVLKALDEKRIYYMAVVPNSKDIYIDRYRSRGSSEEFIEKLDNNFDKFISDVEDSNAYGIYYTDDYLENIYYTENDKFEKHPITNVKYKCNEKSPTFGCTDIEYRMNHAPEIFTGKEIILVPPFYKRRLNSNFFYYDMLDLSEFTDNEDYTLPFNEKVSKYVSVIQSLANSIHIDQRYIVADAIPEVVEEFDKRKCNFTLFLNLDYNQVAFNSDKKFKYPYNDESNTDYFSYMSSHSFRTILSDDFYVDFLNHRSGVISAADAAVAKYIITNSNYYYVDFDNDTIGIEVNGLDTNFSVDSSHIDISERIERFKKEYYERNK